jgi:hypothetical protein
MSVCLPIYQPSPSPYSKAQSPYSKLCAPEAIYKIFQDGNEMVFQDGIKVIFN